MAKFKLLLGGHVQAKYGWEPTEEEKEDAKMRMTRPRAPWVAYNPGDVVESDVDLVAAHGAEKFLLLEGTPGRKAKRIVPRPGEEMTFTPPKEANPEGGPGGQIPGQMPYPRPIVATTREEDLDEADQASVEALDEQKKAGERAQQAKKVRGEEPDFDSMTVKQLHEYAEDEEVDLKGAKTKDEILKTLKKGKR